MDEVADRAPGMLPSLRLSLQPAPLFCGAIVLWSTTGVQQGDPLGPLLFATDLNSALRGLTTPASGLEAWYLNDGAILGPLQDLERQQQNDCGNGSEVPACLRLGLRGRWKELGGGEVEGRGRKDGKVWATQGNCGVERA